jgi:hypothetical protein
VSFLRQDEIYPFDEGAITHDRTLGHWNDTGCLGDALITVGAELVGQFVETDVKRLLEDRPCSENV